jgi:hypothetical protein
MSIQATAHVATDGLQVHDDSIIGPVRDKLAKGDYVEIHEFKQPGKYVQARIYFPKRDVRGWVRMDFLQIDEFMAPAPLPPPPDDPGPTSEPLGSPVFPIPTPGPLFRNTWDAALAALVLALCVAVYEALRGALVWLASLF